MHIFKLVNFRLTLKNSKYMYKEKEISNQKTSKNIFL